MAEHVDVSVDCDWPVISLSETRRAEVGYVDIVAFLVDESRPGCWAHTFDVDVDGYLMHVRISDPDVAFEFKMRFA